MSRGCAVLGSSFFDFPLESLRKVEMDTPFGLATSYAVQGTDSFVQFRHGLPHTLLPTQINWRAQAWMLKALEIDSLLLTSSVGVLDDSISLYEPLLASDLLMPFNQLPDGSVCTMFPKATKDHGHLLLQDGVFHSGLRNILAQRFAITIQNVVFGYVPGPRTKTPIENLFWKQCGAQVNSMSIGPEAILANELEIPVAALVIGHKYSLPNPNNKHTHESIEDSLVRARNIVQHCVWDFVRDPPSVSFSNHMYRFS